MAKTVTIDPRVAEIQKTIAANKQVFGAKQTIKLLRENKLSKIFVTKTVASTLLDDIMYYAKVADVPIEEVSATNEDLGIICKKPFRISVVAVKK